MLLIPLTLLVMAAPWWVAAIYAFLWIVAASIEYLRMYLKPFRWVYLLFLLAPVIIWFYALELTTFSFVTYLFAALGIQAFFWLVLVPKRHEYILPLLVLPVYLGFITAHFVLLKQVAVRDGLSYAWIAFPFVMTWANDTAAYFFGSWLGKTPLCPKVSPKKTVEGFVLGLAATLAIAMGYTALFVPEYSWWIGGLLALAVGGTGVVGDLLESGIKRERGVKNSSNILGGHGGFLDRLDSLIFGVAVYYYLHFLISRL